MSINPSMNDPSHKIPDNKTPPPTPNTLPTPSADSPDETKASFTSMDPSGKWAEFLSGGGQQATPEEVKLFLQAFEKQLQVLIQQNDKAFKRAIQEAKEMGSY